MHCSHFCLLGYLYYSATGVCIIFSRSLHFYGEMKWLYNCKYCIVSPRWCLFVCLFVGLFVFNFGTKQASCLLRWLQSLLLICAILTWGINTIRVRLPSKHITSSQAPITTEWQPPAPSLSLQLYRINQDKSKPQNINKTTIKEDLLKFGSK